LLCTNDSPLNIQDEKLVLFADDINILIMGKNIDAIQERLINRVMKQFETWFSNNSLIINPLNAELNPICHLLALLGAHPILHVSRIRVNTDKTKAMLFHFNKTCNLVKIKIVFNSVKINCTSKVKFLMN
jgi:hypothetical protein